MVYIERKKLEEFCASIFRALGLPHEEALDSSRILTAADARGVKSHGVARIRRYAEGIKAGLIKGGITPTVLHETPISLVLDAEGGMGLSLSKKAMESSIAKAKEHGVGICAVRNSNHFGIAGYYAEMAAREDMIGIAMTNTAALGVPTFAREAAFGTNPIAFAAPGLDGKMFSLDMASTTVTRGKMEVYEREKKPLPPGWAVGTDGLTAQDPVKLLDDMLRQKGGGLLPLGGEGESFGGHKGYGLAVMVDILTALCSGGTFGRSVKDSEITSARVCHFFMALRLDIFRTPEDFKRDMSQLLCELNSLKPATGASRVYYAGQKEHEAEAESNAKGVPLAEGVWETLKKTAKELGIAYQETL
ncbi:Ldh family oxidoreductase [Leadbettera azotonutricia]|uniref:Malate dehydrogenase n=1 Tax=Leadbettera azotonutricia (strain ATCC BAA-888 / DSM 13862 / ZAS-9) TaxID=545695 RepID=F5Y982_LEAAZ|nr:Ldh family oxidoreductase [Leadbettera azotonutricia]AEF83407.1 malate dehydrogenase [Leadbettera azotonutricia ZAS-9]